MVKKANNNTYEPTTMESKSCLLKGPEAHRSVAVDQDGTESVISMSSKLSAGDITKTTLFLLDQAQDIPLQEI
jgi:hypothetical protein